MIWCKIFEKSTNAFQQSINAASQSKNPASQKENLDQPDNFSFAANLDLMENRNKPVKQFVLWTG
jgi:hypothetical protein